MAGGTIFEKGNGSVRSRQVAVGAMQNRLQDEDRAVHEWYRFVLSYPPHLVRTYVERFGLGAGAVVLDPFCGTGTTPIECKKLGIEGWGLEAHPMSCFACDVKTDWLPEPDELRELARRVGDEVADDLGGGSGGMGIGGEKHSTLPTSAMKLLLGGSISPLPLHKCLTILRRLRVRSAERCYRPALLALAKVAVAEASNLHFGPEVGVTRKKKEDADVLGVWLAEVESFAADLEAHREDRFVRNVIVRGDARRAGEYFPDGKVDAVITSPPYPNEKDYTRTTRLESVLLGFVRNKRELRALKERLLRSNTRNVYKDDCDDCWIVNHPKIQEVAERIEARRIEMGKTSGFERMYHRVTRQYFGGMARHLADLRRVLRPGAKLAYVVGDQASYLRVMIRTGELLAEVAQAQGYRVESIDLFRTRYATATGENLREEVVVLEYSGKT